MNELNIESAERELNLDLAEVQDALQQSLAGQLHSYANPRLYYRHFAPGVPKARWHYRVMRRFFQVTMSGLWKIRVFNRHYEPTSGSAVYISNHQSFLDPMLMSFSLVRPMNYMARDTLFNTPIFKQMISCVNAFPVKRGTADLGAMKEAMRRLKAGGQVVLFAEGTRSEDGKLRPFLPGVAMLSQRAADWTVPVLIDGAFEAWPRSQMLPSPGSVVVQYAPPIPQSVARSMPATDFVEMVRQQLIAVQRDVRRRAGRPELDYDK
jgi:1-acyl-sn-glycerol-3-phosphate acyltransferase